MKTKIFISHASADSDVVSLFVDHILRNGCGVNVEDIVYTSREDSGVVNGEDIPAVIKEGILQSGMFFMMVSDSYRRSEVCLNEMGAAWICENLPRKIILLPNVGFDKLGWLVSLKKATKLTDSAGLDAIHDQVLSVFSLHVSTVTWNRSKNEFLEAIMHVSSSKEDSQSLQNGEYVLEEELGILDLQDLLNSHVAKCLEILEVFATEASKYNEGLNSMTRDLNSIPRSSKGVETKQIRDILKRGIRDNAHLSKIYDENAPQLKISFDRAIEYAIKMQQQVDSDELVKADNRIQCQRMIDAIAFAHDKVSGFRKVLDGIINIDKDYNKSKKQLVLSLDNVLDALSFCVCRASEYKLS